MAKRKSKKTAKKKPTTKKSKKKVLPEKKTKSPTEQQLRFISEYMVHFNGPRAAAIAGFKDPRKYSVKLLNGIDFPLVTDEIDRRKRILKRVNSENRAFLLHYISMMATANPADLVDDDGILISNLKELPLGLQHLIAGIKVHQRYNQEGEVIGQKIEIKLTSKIPILEMLAKMLGEVLDNGDGESESKEKLDWAELHRRAVAEKELDVVDQMILDVKPVEKGK